MKFSRCKKCGAFHSNDFDCVNMQYVAAKKTQNIDKQAAMESNAIRVAETYNPPRNLYRKRYGKRAKNNAIKSKHCFTPAPVLSERLDRLDTGKIINKS